MGEVKLTPKVELLIDGSPADVTVMESIIVVRVHQHLEFADTIEVRLSNNNLAWTDGETFVEGTKLTVKFGYQETGTEQVCEGEIVRRDCVFPGRGAGVDRFAPKPGGGFVHQSHVIANAPGPAVITLVAIDREHRLKRGVHSRTFVDMKDSEIVTQLAGEAGLSADVEDTKVKHRYVFQSSQTNLSFIRERAMLLNYEVNVDQENAKLSFRKAAASPTDGGELKWGLNLFRFDLRISAETQVSDVKVKGWDMHAKTGITGSAAKTDIVYEMDGEIVSGSKVAEDHWGTRSVLYTGTPIHEQGEADAMAVAYLNRLSMTYSEGEATCQGDPKLDAGVCITIDGVGIRAGGKFYVYKTIHHYEPGTGYTTQLSLLRSTERTGEAESDPPPKKVEPRTDTPVETEDFVEFNVRSETGESLDGVGYTITFDGGKVEKGTIGADQKIRVEGIKDPGQCKIELNQPDDLNAVG